MSENDPGGRSGPADTSPGTGLGPRSTVALVRLGSMTAQLLEELRVHPVDATGCTRMRDAHNNTVAELRRFLPRDLMGELDSFAPALPADDPASPEALRVAAAQLSGWVAGVLLGAEVPDPRTVAGPRVP